MSYISFYKFLFIFEILIAEFLFTFRLKKRKLFAIRLLFSTIFLLLVAMIPFPTKTFYFNCINFFFLFGMSLLVLIFCYDEPFLNLLFCGMAAYTSQHFAYELTNLAFSILEQGISPLLGMYSTSKIDFSAFDKKTVLVSTLYLICYFVSYWLIYLTFARRIKSGSDLKIKSRTLLSLIGAGVAINIIISSIITYYLYSDSLGASINYGTNTLCGLLLLACQFSQLSTREAERELDFIKKIWNQEKEQYQILHENIDLINIKCHDMRHKIRKLANGKNFSNEELNAIEESIEIYDSAIKTGNEVLDVILTEKGFRFKGKGIKFTSIIDGEAISFLNESDIYSLFGNIMDNAIDATLKIPNVDERLIDLKIYKTSDFVSVNLKNTYFGNIKFDNNGLPITDKSNKDYHGFGMKSIAYIVEKYNGNLSIVVEDGIFNLNILFFNNDSQYK